MAVFVENATKLAMARDEARKAAAEAIREGLKAVAEMRTRAEAAEAAIARLRDEVIEVRAVIPFVAKRSPRCRNCRFWTDQRGPSGRCLLLSFVDAETNSDWLCDDYERDNRSKEDR